jgi:hypothetical protein
MLSQVLFADDIEAEQAFIALEEGVEILDLIEEPVVLDDEEDMALILASLDDGSGLIAAAENLGPNAAGFTGDGDLGPEGDGFLDPRVLRDFIESRGLIKCRQNEGNLILAGDTRARWTTIGETVNGDKVRGTGTKTAINSFVSDFNLILDYTALKGWVTNKIKFANYDGSDGGTAVKVTIDRAFMGYDIYHVGDTDFYIEIGRSKLDYLFESRVEFTTFFDGIHFFYTQKIPRCGQLTLHGGPFIIDSFTNHYGWAVEAFLVDWADTGFRFKYSIIDWHRSAPTLNYGNKLPDAGKITIENNPRYNFIVSQMLFGYEKKLEWPGCKLLYAYAAVLCNHDATRSPTTHGKKLNNAWYVGFTLGKLCKAFDWSLDINYQSVQAQAVPEFDLAGIGHGNAGNDLFSDAVILGLAPALARGFTNYKGWEASLLYALTDSLSMRAQAASTRPRNKSIGGDFNYVGFSMAVIFAF